MHCSAHICPKMLLATVHASLILSLMVATSSEGAQHTQDNVLDFFPESQGDGLNIIWAHGVNSHEELDQTLSDDTMMLETDIILRGIGTVNETDIPVNAHPPDTDSDLLVVDFVNKTTSTPGKGMKLDFKYLEALGPTMEIVQSFDDQLNCPLWINADIVKGPNSPKDPISPVEFIETANGYFDKTVMSLGFTTSTDGPGDMYTWTMIFDVLQYTYGMDPQPVTYPIRAVWSVRSWSKFTFLLGLRESFSITVWSGSSDDVDVQGLLSLREHGDIRRIFYDLPTDLRTEFLTAIGSGTPTPDAKFPSNWNRDLWTSYTSDVSGNFVFLSTESAGISGTEFRAGYTQSNKEYTAVEDETLVIIRGTVQFVDRYEASTNEAVAEIFVRSNPLDDTDPNLFREDYTVESVRLEIHRDGAIRIGREQNPSLIQQLPAAECYFFQITDKGGAKPFDAVVSVVTCNDAIEANPDEGQTQTISLTSETVDSEYQSFVIFTKRGSSGDVIVENLNIETENGARTIIAGGIVVLLTLLTTVSMTSL